MDDNLIKLAKIANIISFTTEDKIEKILDTGYDINYAVPISLGHRNHVEGYTALHFAVKNHVDDHVVSILNLLISRGADITYKNYEGFTPLGLAYKQPNDENSWEVMKHLICAHMTMKNPTNPHCNDGTSHLHIACITNNLSVVEFFLDSGAPVNEAISVTSKKFPGCTCLHLAMYNKDENMVRLLLNYGADLMCLNADGKSPLHIAIEQQVTEASFISLPTWFDYNMLHKKTENILYLLSTLDIKDLNDGFGLSYFHVYCTKKYNNPELEKLADNEADVNASINFDSPFYPGYTPLHFAAHCSLQTVMLLLEKGANVMAEDKRGKTPLDLCLRYYRPSDISRIIKTQNSLKSIQLENGDMLPDAISQFDTPEKLRGYLKTNDVNTRIPLDSPLWPGSTFLHLAVILQQDYNTSRIDACLSHCSDTSIQDANKMTALHLAFYLGKSYCIEKIMSNTMDCLKNLTDKNGLSYLHIACINNNLEFVEKLLCHGENPNIPIQPDKYQSFYESYKHKLDTKIGFTPLHLAAANQSEKMINLLLKHGADSQVPDLDGFTWVHRVFFNFRALRSLDLYFKQNGNSFTANPVCPGGLSYFHIACYLKNFDAVKTLLPLMSNINLPLTSELMNYCKKLPHYVQLDDTPLHLAAKICVYHLFFPEDSTDADSIKIFDLLLKNGAHIRAKNAQGLKPIHYGLLYNKPSMVRSLLEHEKKDKWSDDTGLTELHVACALKDVSMIEALLKAGEHPNSRIKMDSAIWPGWTPLYVLIKRGYPDEDSAVKLLLKYILKKYEVAVPDDQHEITKRQKMSLPKDELIVGPKRQTAFHVSCMTGDAAIVEKFLNLGIDINEPTEYFDFLQSGSTGLHFAVKYGHKNVVELLLKNGAHISCAWNTICSVLHEAAFSSPDLLSVLFSTGTEFNLDVVDAMNKTVFDLLFNNDKSNIDHFREILKHEYIMKKFSVTSKIDLVMKFFHKLSMDDFKLVSELIPNITDVDDNGRSVIHHIALNPKLFDDEDKCQDELIRKIDWLETIGCDIDLLDFEGQSPLHCAVEHTDAKKSVKFFLSIGANVNTIDHSNNTPITSTRSVYYDMISEFSNRLNIADLFIQNVNESYHLKADSLILSMDLDEMMKVKIYRSYSLCDVLTKKIIDKFPTMPVRQRRIILSCVDSNELLQKFPTWLPVFRFQRRRLIKMEKLYKSALISLQDLSDSRLPELCLESIMFYLSVEDWKNVLESDDEF